MLGADAADNVLLGTLVRAFVPYLQYAHSSCRQR